MSDCFITRYEALLEDLAMSEGVDSGVVSAPLKSRPNASDGVVVEQSTRNVSPINDTRRHPDATLAQSVATMSFAGFTMDMVCRALRLSESTVRKYYDYEFKNGQSNMVSEIAGSLAQRAKAGSDTAAIFLLKTRGNGRFNDRQQVELSGQIEVTHRTELMQELAGLLSAPNVIEGEVVDDKPV